MVVNSLYIDVQPVEENCFEYDDLKGVEDILSSSLSGLF
jgi:hypothetical protein